MPTTDSPSPTVEDRRRRLRLQPGQEIAGVRVVAATDRRVSKSVVYRVECLGCDTRYERTAISMKQAPKGLGCKGCWSKRAAGRAAASKRARRERVVARFLSGDRLADIARSERLTVDRAGRILAAGIRPERVADALRVLPPAALLAAVLTLSPGGRRRVLTAALTKS